MFSDLAMFQNGKELARIGFKLDDGEK